MRVRPTAGGMLFPHAPSKETSGTCRPFQGTVPTYHGGAPVISERRDESDHFGNAGARNDEPAVHERDQQTVDLSDSLGHRRCFFLVLTRGFADFGEAARALHATVLLHQRRDRVEQLRFLIRLAQVVVDAQLDSAGTMLLAHARRDHDDRHIGEARIVAHVTGHFVTIHARHLDVEQDDVGDVVLQEADGVETVARGDDAHAVAFEQTLRDATDGDRVVHHHDERPAVSPSRAEPVAARPRLLGTDEAPMSRMTTMRPSPRIVAPEMPRMDETCGPTLFTTISRLPTSSSAMRPVECSPARTSTTGMVTSCSGSGEGSRPTNVA